jgi:hypothetical protein
VTTTGTNHEAMKSAMSWPKTVWSRCVTHRVTHVCDVRCDVA